MTRRVPAARRRTADEYVQRGNVGKYYRRPSHYRVRLVAWRDDPMDLEQAMTARLTPPGGTDWYRPYNLLVSTGLQLTNAERNEIAEYVQRLSAALREAESEVVTAEQDFRDEHKLRLALHEKCKAAEAENVQLYGYVQDYRAERDYLCACRFEHSHSSRLTTECQHHREIRERAETAEARETALRERNSSDATFLRNLIRTNTQTTENERLQLLLIAKAIDNGQ